MGNCGCPESCTASVLNSLAGPYTCQNRIDWMIKVAQFSERDACIRIAREEFSISCSPCDPDLCAGDLSVGEQGEEASEEEGEELNHMEASCGICSDEICKSDLNKCMFQTAPFLCLSGGNVGGCSPVPWNKESCPDCCKLV